MSRAVAPALRSGFQNARMEFELPVICSPKVGLPYSLSSGGACSTTTLLKSVSSSSARIMGIAVYVPCPISTCGIISVVCPDRSMRINALGANLPSVLSGGCSGSFTALAGRWKPSTKAPANPLRRTARREGEPSKWRSESIGSLLCLTVARGALDRLANADIGAATADVACHGSVDVGIIRIWRGREQSRRRHDLTRLAIAALNDFQIEPRPLNLGARWRRADAFDRGDDAIADRTDG